jgi:hypothetical protein
MKNNGYLEICSMRLYRSWSGGCLSRILKRFQTTCTHFRSVFFFIQNKRQFPFCIKKIVANPSVRRSPRYCLLRSFLKWNHRHILLQNVIHHAKNASRYVFCIVRLTFQSSDRLSWCDCTISLQRYHFSTLQ